MIIEGLGHCDAGEIIEVGAGTAQHIIGAGMAEEHLAENESAAEKPTTVRIENPQNRDPQPKRIAPAPTKEQLRRGKAAQRGKAEDAPKTDGAGDGSGQQDAGDAGKSAGGEEAKA